MNIQSNNKQDYTPYIFCCPDFQSAASIILDHHSQPWNERWERESKYIISLIKSNIELDANSVVLDYGCGVGRLSKLIIETYGCTVVGIDLMPSMLKYAIQYVNSPKFIALQLDSWNRVEFQADFALSVWTIQHCPDAETVIKRIKTLLKPDACFYCLNDNFRYIPNQRREWIDDGVDVLKLIQKQFQTLKIDKLPVNVTSSWIHKNTWWGIFKKAEKP